ncbi:MAG: hypothetical protein L3J10_05520 [Sulfurimonas sp.]|nr:hypothetical protein [Sulfurimonas sp.]
MIKQIFITIIFLTTSLRFNYLLNTQNKNLSYNFGYTIGESLLKSYNTQNGAIFDSSYGSFI